MLFLFGVLPGLGVFFLTPYTILLGVIFVTDNAGMKIVTVVTIASYPKGYYCYTIPSRQLTLAFFPVYLL